MEIADYPSLWENHIKFANFISKGGVQLLQKEREKEARGKGKGETYKEIEKAIDMWFDALPPFITEYCCSEKALLQVLIPSLFPYFMQFNC